MKFTNSAQTKVAATSNIYETTDYDQFVQLLGNRPVDETHVKRLMRKIEREGNLTPEHPIQVNEKREVIDGQHRLEALKRLGMPVYFEERHGLNIDNVASLNTGNKNWTWQDYAQHWASRGNTNYVKFLEAAGIEPRFQVLMVYLTGTRNPGGRGSRSEFDEGNLQIQNFELSMKLLNQYRELSDTANIDTRDFAVATYRYMRLPGYNHEKMLAKVSAYGEALFGKYSISEYLQALEEIYEA